MDWHELFKKYATAKVDKQLKELEMPKNDIPRHNCMELRKNIKDDT